MWLLPEIRWLLYIPVDVLIGRALLVFINGPFQISFICFIFWTVNMQLLQNIANDWMLFLVAALSQPLPTLLDYYLLAFVFKISMHYAHVGFNGLLFL